MELPFHLKTLEPLKGALDILRIFNHTGEDTAHADDIIDTLGLSEKTFSKAMRRLITKGYIQMDGNMIYRLTEEGHNAAGNLAEYDSAEGDAGGQPEAPAQTIRDVVTRRLVAVLPKSMDAKTPTTAYIGFHDADEGTLPAPVELVVRATVVNGEPSSPEDLLFSLHNEHTYQTMQLTPGDSDVMRLKLYVYQLGDMGDISQAGGMYVDLPVGGGDGMLQAYGTDLSLQPEA